MRSRASTPKRPRDTNQLAWQIVQEATGQAPRDVVPEPDTRNPAAVALSKLGASKGGLARAAALSPAKRRAIAKKAVAARWGKQR
ncbi:MAG: hypothetical protein ACRD2N_20235 [Vicinamibacterales bacterium]